MGFQPYRPGLADEESTVGRYADAPQNMRTVTEDSRALKFTTRGFESN
jgi:hypothetical protein